MLALKHGERFFFSLVVVRCVVDPGTEVSIGINPGLVGTIETVEVVGVVVVVVVDVEVVVIVLSVVAVSLTIVR